MNTHLSSLKQLYTRSVVQWLYGTSTTHVLMVEGSTLRFTSLSSIGYAKTVETAVNKHFCELHASVIC